jgi:hypothetical protein
MSKVNWSNAHLDEREPITLRTAYWVGAILKHVPTDAQSNPVRLDLRRPDLGQPPRLPNPTQPRVVCDACRWTWPERHMLRSDCVIRFAFDLNAGEVRMYCSGTLKGANSGSWVLRCGNALLAVE